LASTEPSPRMARKPTISSWSESNLMTPLSFGASQCIPVEVGSAVLCAARLEWRSTRWAVSIEEKHGSTITVRSESRGGFDAFNRIAN
jgi:hypothetical protein